MKETFLYLFLAVSGIVSAQNVNIPDANFKEYLLHDSDMSIDANNDGEIQVAEALAVTSLLLSERTDATFESLEGLEAFTNITDLTIYSNVTAIDISRLSSLTRLNIFDRYLTSLNISGLTNLNFLTLESLKITTLDLSGSLNLTGIIILDLNNLTSLVIGNNIHFESIYFVADNLTNLDLSGCPNLQSVVLNFRTDQDVFLNLKNGNAIYNNNSAAIRIGDYVSTNKCYVCIDEGEENQFSNFTDDLVLSTYCSFTPGGTYNTIAGTFTYDSNNNGCDTADNAMISARINMNHGTETGSSFTSSDGTYNFYTQSGNFILTPQFENDWFSASPPSVTVDLATVDAAAINTHNFCITSNGVHPDVEVAIIPIGNARPGFDAAYKIVYKNKGNQTLSGDVTFTYNDDVLDYVLATPPASTLATGSLTWSYTNLLPFETREIKAVLNVNGPMETPAVNIDDVLTFITAVTPVAGDESIADNSFNYKQDVVGSFDPNDITCLEGATVSPDKIGEYLHYNINFENTGTAAATFIVVKDIVNTAKFDVNTLQVLNASHAVDTRVTGNKVEFIFNDINLGASEKGNVMFKIKTLNTLAVNSEVTQQADIFFDYNWPIQTNEATTTFAILNSGGFTVDNAAKIYPNPTDGIVNISAKAEIRSVQLYDVQGRLLQSGTGTKIDISDRTMGIYFIKIITDEGMKVEKLIKK